MELRHQRGIAFSIATAISILASPAVGQVPVRQASEPGFETRARLRELERAAESQGRTTEASLIASRLQHGDFQEGDKILLSVAIPGLPAISTPGGSAPDTVVLRTGKLLAFTRVPNIPDFSLEGVLRSELNDTITIFLSKYLRDPIVRAIPLLRVGVMGAVGRPGWYSATGDMVLADVIMQAGGVVPESAVSETTIRRAGTTIWNSEAVKSALAEGLSLDRLNLRAGDEILVPQKRQLNVTTTLQIVAGLLAALVALRTLK